jgi:hypothetical protein
VLTYSADCAAVSVLSAIIRCVLHSWCQPCLHARPPLALSLCRSQRGAVRLCLKRGLC